MPDETIYLTDIEREILMIFVKKKVLDDFSITGILDQLVKKLEK